jgi:hypothetical protein
MIKHTLYGLDNLSADKFKIQIDFINYIDKGLTRREAELLLRLELFINSFSNPEISFCENSAFVTLDIKDLKKVYFLLKLLEDAISKHFKSVNVWY